MKPTLLQLPTLGDGRGCTGIYWYARHLAEALRRFVDVEAVVPGFGPFVVRGREYGGLVGPAMGRFFKPLQGSLVHAPHVTHLHRRSDVLTIHDLCPFRYPSEYEYTRRLFRLHAGKVRRMQCFVTPSATVREEVLEHFGFDDDRVFATPLGVQQASVTPEKESFALMVGEARPRKRSLEAVQAATRAGVKVVRVGPPLKDPYGQEVALELHRGGHEDRGYASPEKLRGLMARAKVLLYPSLYEGFGLPPVEAASHGTQTVTGPASVFQETLGSLQWTSDGTVLGIHEALMAAWERPLDPFLLHGHVERYSWDACAVHTLAAYTAQERGVLP